MQIAILIFILAQILFTHYFLARVINKSFSNKLVLNMRFGIFILPIFFFYGRAVRFELKKEFGKDEVSLNLEKIYFFVNPFYLMFGKVELFLLRIVSLDGSITSWIPSQEKIAWLPPANKIWIKNGTLKNGNLTFFEKSKFPNQKIDIQAIEIENCNLDLAYPLQLFFFAKLCTLKIGSGMVKTELILAEQGFVKIQGVKWTDILKFSGISIQGIGGEINLHANYKHIQKGMSFRGVFGKKEKLESKQDTKNERFAFQFLVEWEKFHLPLDLGLYNLFYLIFKNTFLTGVLQVTVIPILDLLNKTLKTNDQNY